jgi:acetylornithine deacetylase/succinyl-diaminopimelate desuccinylase-like protein
MKFSAAILDDDVEDFSMKLIIAVSGHQLNVGHLPEIVFDGEQTDCSAWTRNVGIAAFTITTYGRSSHFSLRYTHHPAYRGSYQNNAIDKMLKIMNEMKDVKRNFVHELGQFLGDPVISFGKIETKVAAESGRACLGADECNLQADIRFPACMTKESCKRDLERIIYNLSIDDPELRATVQTSSAPFGTESVPMFISHLFYATMGSRSLFDQEKCRRIENAC